MGLSANGMGEKLAAKKEFKEADEARDITYPGGSSASMGADQRKRRRPHTKPKVGGE